MTEEMKKFEMGKKYIIDSVEFAGNVTVEVISRTSKFATFKKLLKKHIKPNTTLL